MRIAVLVYGRINKCAEHYENIIESIGKENKIDFFLSSDNAPNEQLHTFIELYKPVAYNNDRIEYDCDLSKYPGKRDETNLHNMICHFINKARVFSLLENSIEKQSISYDAVLSLRVDLVFHTRFNFKSMEDDVIYIPSDFDFIPFAINDQIAYGTINVMKKYCEIFYNVIPILEGHASIPHPESLTYANLCFNEVNVRRVRLSYHIEK